MSSTTIDGIAQYLYTTYYYKSGNCARVLYSDLSDPDISVMIAVQHDSLWGSHPLAKLEAILRCLMTKRLGDNIDTQSHPLSTCSRSGQRSVTSSDGELQNTGQQDELKTKAVRLSVLLPLMSSCDSKNNLLHVSFDETASEKVCTVLICETL